jgi:hypothetical protein
LQDDGGKIIKNHFATIILPIAFCVKFYNGKMMVARLLKNHLAIIILQIAFAVRF